MQKALHKRDEELERFKQQIDLSEYAKQSFGYEVDEKKSYANCLCLKSDRDKIFVKQDVKSGNWVYASVTDSNDKGSIVDFLQQRRPLNLGQVRQELRGYLGISRITPVKAAPPKPAKEKPSISHKELLVKLKGMSQDATKAKFLNKRGIDAATIKSRRFAGTVLSDRKSNAIFPHRNFQGYCGLERRNSQFKSFLKGGKKGLWVSKTFKSDKYLFVAESPLDCLAHAQMHPARTDIRYVATSGMLANETKKLLLAAAKRIREIGGKVVLGLDNDEAGRKMTEELKELVKTNVVRVPQAKDWSDDLAHKKQQEKEQEFCLGR